MARPRILVLGAGGFVGGHLRADLERRFGGAARLVLTTRDPSPGCLSLDLTDAEAVRDMLRHEKPTHVVNLAGIAAPVEARRKPALAWAVHATAPEQLGRLILEEVPDCWLLHVGSGLVYGQAAANGTPVDETTLLDPMDPYGVTKAAGDLALGALARDGLNCLRLRPFNHTGPGQTGDFAVPAFAEQIARIEAGRQEPVLRVGNLSAVRDFLDVRDVAAAYGLLIAQSDRMQTGAIFNIASGRGTRMDTILDTLVAMSRASVTVEPDPARQRPSDLPAIVGDAGALAQATGWAPAYGLEATLAETLEFFREREQQAEA